jgi:RNA polymerase sigma factor (sigma-70 family)
MENDLRIVFREMQSKKRLSNILKISLDETYYKDSDTVSKVTLKDIIPDRKNLEDEIIANMFLNDLLSEKEKDLIELRLEGKDQRAIAKMFNLSQPEISRRLLKIKKKIRNFNEVNGY